MLRTAKRAIPPALLDARSALTRKRALRSARAQLSGADKLHLGCGTTLIEGWANVDILSRPGVIQLDLTWGLPIPGGSMVAVFIEHMLEELALDQARQLLGEVRRVLQPGGVIRVSTPDLAVLVDEYVHGRTDYWAPVGWCPKTPCDVLNEGMRFWGNQYVYDRRELEELFRSVGFDQVRFVDWRESEIEHLRDLETRPYHRELIIEATK